MLNLLTLWCIPVHNELITPIIRLLGSKRVNNRYKTIRLKLTILSHLFVGKSSTWTFKLPKQRNYS